MKLMREEYIGKIHRLDTEVMLLKEVSLGLIKKGKEAEEGLAAALQRLDHLEELLLESRPSKSITPKKSSEKARKNGSEKTTPPKAVRALNLDTEGNGVETKRKPEVGSKLETIEETKSLGASNKSGHESNGKKAAVDYVQKKEEPEDGGDCDEDEMYADCVRAEHPPVRDLLRKVRQPVRPPSPEPNPVNGSSHGKGPHRALKLIKLARKMDREGAPSRAKSEPFP
jgi:hypothetical protein